MTELHRHVSSVSESLEINQILKPTEDSTKSKIEIDSNYESNCEKSHDDYPQTPVSRPQITVKSFDMPNIDCDEQMIEPITIKQEADETGYEDCSYRCEPTSTTEKPKCQDSFKRYSVEKSHPGIENVVEKLKKNAAAALQETTAQKIDDSKDKNAENLRSRKHSDTVPRKLENGLKKHILRSCENSPFLDKHDVNREPEVSSSETVRIAKDSQDISKYLTTTEHTSNSSMNKHPLSKNYFTNDNNNDIRNSNNNIKMIDEDPVVKKEKSLSPEVCELVEMKCTDSDVTPKKYRKMETSDNSYASTPDNQIIKSRAVNSKQKPTVDISGLELLSNSIEQLEHLKPDSQNSGTVSELEKSPIRSKLISPQGESNNNNVDSPLGLLCALAEQRFMEEVGDKIPRKLNLESSEEISHAGRLLLNLGRVNIPEKEGKTTDKRKYVQTDIENYENSKRFKTDGESEDEECSSLHYQQNNNDEKLYDEKVQEDVMFRLKETTRRSIDFSEQNGTSSDDEEVTMLKNAPLNKNISPYKNVNYERNENFEEYERHYDQYQMNGTYSSKESIDGNLSDSDMEIYDKKSSNEKIEKEDSIDVKRRLSTEHRDCHDYRNLQAKLDAKKFIARKGHIDNEADWPNMDAMELDMRVRLADIQRQYREKQKELSKLTPKKDEKKSPGRPRKKSHSSR